MLYFIQIVYIILLYVYTILMSYYTVFVYYRHGFWLFNILYTAKLVIVPYQNLECT